MKKIIKFLYNKIPFKKELFSIARKLPLPSFIYRHLHFKGVFRIKFQSYEFLMKHYGYQLENEIFWKGLTNGWERISMQLWIELCKDANVILDIGANTGVYSLIAKSVNPSAFVYGFEPVERVYKKFTENCDLNKYKIQTFRYALSDYDGTAVIYDTPSEHVYSVTVNKNLSPQNKNLIETTINTKRLSSFITENNIKSIDLIKMDVETHEPEVLRGMGSYLMEFQPTLLIEVLNDEIGEMIQSLIKDIDYLYFNIDEVNMPKRVDKITKSGYYNYLICKKEIAEKLNLR